MLDNAPFVKLAMLSVIVTPLICPNALIVITWFIEPKISKFPLKIVLGELIFTILEECIFKLSPSP